MTTLNEAIERARCPAETVARHMLRIRIIGAIGAERLSPKDLADALNAPLGVIAYHVRELHKAGLLTQAGTRRVRGTFATYYRVTPEGVRAVGDLCDVTASAVASTIDLPERAYHRESRA